MMYNLKNSLSKINKQKITYITLSSILVAVGIVLTISTAQTTNAAVPSILITITDADGNAGDTDDETTATREKTATATDGTNNAGTRWEYKRIASSARCNAAQMSAGTRSGNQVRMNSEAYNGNRICFKATNGNDVAYLETDTITGIDRTRPNAPTNITLDPGDDTGTSQTDGLTKNTNGLTIIGCAEENSTVELLIDGRPLIPAETSTANGSSCTTQGTNQFTFDISLAERSKAYVIGAKATDEAKNTSPESRQRKNIIIDTTAPTVALTHRVAGGTPGEKNDGITYLNTGDTITISATFTEANGMSADPVNQPTIGFYNDEDALGSGEYTTHGTGNVRTVTHTISSTENVANNELRYDITNEASIIDKAGNELATQSTQTIANTVIDTTEPSVNSITFSSTSQNENWATESDEITATITFSEKISEKSSNTGIYYRLGNTGAGQRFTFTSGRSVLSGQCQESSTPNEYNCKYTVTSGDAGEFQVAVTRFTDYAGNAGTKTDFTGTITADTTIAPPSDITLIRGIKERDSNTAPSFVVTVGENSGHVTLYADSDCSTEISEETQISDSTRPFTVEVQINDYANDGSDDGEKTIYATHEDGAGNISACSTGYGTYTLDTSAPAIDEDATGYYSNADLTRAIALTNGEGKVTAGDSIYTKVVFDEEVKYRPGSSEKALPEIKYTIGEDERQYRIVSNASTLSGGRCQPTKRNNISDTYICQYKVRTSDIGTFTLIVDTKTEDLLEHTLEQTYTHADSIILDNTPPSKPSNLDLNTNDDSGDVTDDNITNKTTSITIEGCAEADSTVTLYADDTSITDATDTADDTSYSCTNDTEEGFSIDISLIEGVHKITAKATDTSRNTSAASDVLTITIDTTAPTAILTGTPAGTNDSDVLDVTVGGTDVTHYQYAIFSGTSCTNANYISDDTGGTTITDKITASTPQQDGSIILCVIGRDKAGNWQAKADVTTATWTRDTTKPTKPTGLALDETDDTGLLATDGITKKVTDLTIIGCAEEDSAVEILKDGSSFSTKVTDVADTTDTACAGATKKFSADISLTDGDKTYAITAKATDQSGNVSDESDELTIEIRAIAPKITATNLDLATDDDSGTKTDDDITNKKTGLTISGTLSGAPATNDYVQLYDGTDILEGAKSSSFTGQNNNWSIDDITLSKEGIHTINARVLDAAGNEGVATNIIITIDTIGPTVSVTKHIESPTTDATPSIKIRTSAAGVVSFGGACTDTSKNPAPQTVTAGENTVTLPTLENKIYSDCTVTVEDETGNLSAEAKINTFTVDNTPPVIDTAAINNAVRTETKVTLNEKVYAPTAPAPNDFQIEIGGIAYADLVTGISGIARTKTSATQSFIIRHSELPEGNIAIKYIKGTNHIFDQIDNTLETSRSSTPIDETQFVSVTLHADDDTGYDTTDGLTRFDGNEVTLTISLNTGTFTSGDRVRVFMGNRNTVVASYTISGSIVGSQYIDADNETSFNIVLPKNRFSHGTNSISASYVKAGSIESGRGTATTIVYDNTAPIARVQNPNTDYAAEKEVSAVDNQDNEKNPTTWEYKVLTESVQVCNEAAMQSGTSDYTEGDPIVFKNTDENGNRVCFSVTDTAGNTTYIVSNQLSNIDTTEPTITSVSVTSTARTATRVSLNEPVFATTNINPNDFRIVSGQAQYIVTGVTGLATSSNAAKTSFTLTHVPLGEVQNVTLQYTKGSADITDIAGNILQGFTEEVANRQFVTLELDQKDDTGTSTTDGITQFDGDEVSFTISLTSGTFTYGDQIQIYERGRTAALKRIIVASAGLNTIDASGATSFTITLEKQLFTEGIVMLYATYTPVGQITSTNGIDLTLTYDTTAPTITITEAGTSLLAEKTVSATGGGTATTEWMYTQIQSEEECNENALQGGGEIKYTKGEKISLTNEDDNNTKICFSATDLAGNTAYKSTNVITGIDTEAPTVSSISVTRENEITVTMSEPVYAVRNPNPEDFVVFVNDSHVITTTITGIQKAANRAHDTFFIYIADTIRADDIVALSYIGSSQSNKNELIKDSIGNTLATFDKITATLPTVVTIKLDPADDIGADTTDGITRFGDDSEVKFVVTLSQGTFRDGDRVRIYRNNENRPIASIAVGIRNNEVNARGEASLTVTIAKTQFTVGTSTFHATYQPRLGNEGLPSTLLSITYDVVAPEITIANPDTNPARSKDISAIDDESSEETLWTHKQIAGDAACNAEQMASGTESYTEGADITFDKEDDNGTRVCFSASDAAGNTAYARSRVLEGIDITGSTITITNPTDAPASSKNVKAVAKNNETKNWMYKQIAGDAACNAEQMASGTESYTEGADITFDKEDDNGTRVCFSATDTIDNTSYEVSTVLRGIDTTSPKITVRNSETGSSTSKTVSAGDADTTKTIWGYIQIGKNETCGRDIIIQSQAKEYTEGADITLDKESDNETKICFFVFDLAVNFAHQESEVIVGIDKTPPTITITNPTDTPQQEKVVRADDSDSEETTWKYKKIASSARCNTEQMASGTESYTEGADITFDKEDDNGTKVCFSATDIAGNVEYERSAVLKNIDTTAPIITVNNPDVNIVSSSKKVYATDNEESSRWTYQQIDENAPCDASTIATATSYTEGADIIFDKESDNNTKVCFTTSDTAGNIATRASVTLMNIKEDALTITITTNPWIDFDQQDDSTITRAQAKAIIGTDSDDTKTTWFYKQIAGNAICNSAVRNDKDIKPYTEGEPIILRDETDNGTKICFISVDSAGKITATASEIISGVDTTMPTIVITETENAVSARDTDTSESTWTHKRIAGDDSCDASQMSNGAEPYTEAEKLELDIEQHNGTKVCFSVTDAANNTSYKASETLSAVSITVSSWTDPAIAEDPSITRAQAKAVIGTDGNSTKTTWFYKQIAGNAICNSAVRNDKDIKPYTEGEPIILRDETDNGTKICFISVDSAGKITATASEIISGVDTTMPTIVITNPTTDPAQEKVVIAFDRDSGETSWKYKQIASDAVCNSDTFAFGAQEYIENTPLKFAKESDNGTRICFSVIDSADNTAYATSDVLTDIDSTSPIISSAKLIDVSRTQTKITINKHVHTEGRVSPSDFKIEIENIPYPATGISRFEQSVNTQETTFVITHPAIVPGVVATLSYSKGTIEIIDATGNALEDFNGHPLSDKAFVALTLDRLYDTGISETDGITNFVADNIASNEVTLIATISEGSFSNGDVVHLYRKGSGGLLKKVLISGGLVDAVNAHGEAAFEIVLPKSTFIANEETTLYTVYTPADGSNSDGQRGSEFTVSYRTTAPKVTVTTSDVSAATTIVRATDENEVDETVWHYKQIKSDEKCNAETLSQGVNTYIEGAEIAFGNETDNDTEACFSSTDIAGNTAYASSDVITIDLTAPAITVQPLSDKSEKAKIVRANDNDKRKTTWKYRVIQAERVCDANTMSGGNTRSYKEGSGLKFSKEEANGYKVCFSSTDTSGNVLYAESMTIQGIDTTAPHITVTMEGDGEKTIRARDADATGATSWKYRVIKGNEGCTKETIQEVSRAYREGSGLVFRNSRANGYKVCFAAIDNAGNVSYRTSNTMRGIGSPSAGSVPSSSALQDVNRPTNTASPLAPITNPLYPITKTP